MVRPRELATSAGRSVGIFPARTPTLPPATHTNSYALGGREVLLVEPATPYEDEQRDWIAWARELTSTGREIKAIVATHHHPDHVDGAALLARELGLPIWAHEQTAARIDVPVARHLAEGDEIVLAGPHDESWRVLHTPGHAPGHVCLLEPQTRTVVVGDMVASVGTILIAPGDGDMAVYLHELERLAALDAKLALPAHGDPIDDPTELFLRYIAHRNMREEKIVRVLRSAAGGLTVAQLLPSVYDDVTPAMWPFASLVIAAHLEKLEREGRVSRSSVTADVFVAL